MRPPAYADKTVDYNGSGLRSVNVASLVRAVLVWKSTPRIYNKDPKRDDADVLTDHPKSC